MSVAPPRQDLRDRRALGGISARAYTPLRTAYASLLMVAYAASFLAVTALAVPGSAPEIIPAFILAVPLVLLSLSDMDRMRLPDALNAAMLLAGVAMAARVGSDAALWALGSAAVGFLSLWALGHGYRVVRGRDGIGLGDAKLLAAGGAWVGAGQLALVVLVAASAALVVVGFVLGRRLRLESAIPFGPFLAGGIWVVWLSGFVFP